MENFEIDLNENPLKDVLVIVLLYKNENFGVRAPYDIDIMGKKMWEWVALAGNGAKIKTTPCTSETDVVGFIKPFVKDEKYTIVLYSDTPLISKENILEILEYFKSKSLNVLTLRRGYVFNSEYLINCERVLGSVNPMFDGEEFEMVDNFEKLVAVTEKIRNKILNFHIKNGINITNPASTFIDADVVIEKGATIKHNNTISGQCYIGENVILEPNNVIKDSIISSNVVVRSSFVLGSRISENKIVGPFDKIIDKNV